MVKIVKASGEIVTFDREKLRTNPHILDPLKISLNKKDSILNQCKILCHKEQGNKIGYSG